MRRVRLVLSRWFSLFCCGVVAGAIVVSIEPVLGRITAPVADRLARLGPLPATIVATVLVGAACWYAGGGRWRGFLGIRHFFSYPPLWFAMIVGFGAWLGADVWVRGPQPVRSTLDDALWFYGAVPCAVWWVLLGTITFAAVVPLLPNPRPQGARRTHASRDDTTSTDGDFSEMKAWLRDDSEISSPTLDRFGHDAVALRIANRLQAKDEAPTMAVIGPLGSGKSTIGRLVSYHLQRKPAVRLVEVSLWPFDSAESAVRGVLRALTRELGKNVNVLALVGLSDDYVTAIEKTAGAYGGVARLLRGSTDPGQIVARFSDIASAAGLRLVLWIEDLERFSGGDQLDGPARVEREVERLGPIRALLHLLDRSPCISVVVSDTSLRTRFDLGKIARFVEQPPTMDADHVWKVTSQIRDHCLSGYPVAVLDPASKEARAALVPSDDAHQISAWLSSFRDSRPSIPAAIAQVLRTPRALKAALRITLETWEKLPGEIDLDSVLVISVLRVARPDLFALVSDHLEPFRHGLKDPFTIGGEKKPHRVVADIDKLLQGEDERSAAALRTLLSFSFPQYPPDGTNAEEEYIARPQALFVCRHADYWRRYLTQAPVDAPESDQRALASIAAWRDNGISDLIDRIIDPTRSDQIEQFVGQFRSAELCRLVGEVADRLRPHSARDWEHRAHAPGITAVWRMMHKRRPPDDLVFQTILDIVRRNAPEHLPLAHDITYFFAGSSSGVMNLMSEAHRTAVAQALQDTLLTSYVGVGAEDRLRGALKDGSPWLIGWVAWSGHRGGGPPALPFERWPEFANVLLNLAEADPQVGVPLVIPFMTRSNMALGYRQNEQGETERVGGWVGQFDADTARRLFDFDRLVRILAGFEPGDDLDPQITAHCRAAVDAARAVTPTPQAPLHDSAR